VIKIYKGQLSSVDTLRKLQTKGEIKKMMKIAISMQKGGVAKTTNTINLAGAAAAEGLDVLAVDTDPQGYLTLNLGLREEYTRKDLSFHQAWLEPKSVDISDVIVEHPEFDVLPANHQMFSLQQELIAEGYQLLKRLDKIFKNLPDYDVVFVDAPPSLGLINDNVLIATENIIIPMEARETSVLALEHLLGQIKTLEKRFDISITERGVIISDVNYPLNSEQEAMIDWANRMYEGQCPLYEIRDRKLISEAQNAGYSIFGVEETCDQEEKYKDFIQELMVVQ
jgi:chromosome partitioning protein